MALGYPSEILRERSVVLHELAERDAPHMQGSVVDSAGTFSHEQGMWLSHGRDRADLFIVDTTAFAPGGYTDAYGLLHITSANTRNQEAKGSRLFADPIIYRKLNMSEPGCPAIRFTLDRELGGEWRVQGVDKARFFAETVSTAGTDTRDLMLTERDLESAVSGWLRSIEEEHHIGLIHDGQGRMAAHRPLRVWSDFKNLQIITDLLVHRSAGSVLTAASHQRAQQHVFGETNIRTVEEAQQILQSTPDIESHLATILSLEDISRYKLSTEAFTHFCNAIMDGLVDVQKIVGIGQLTGAIAVRASTDGTMAVHGAGKELIVRDWDEFLVTALQATDRSETEKLARDRRIHQEQQRRIAEERSALQLSNVLKTWMSRGFSPSRIRRR